MCKYHNLVFRDLFKLEVIPIDSVVRIFELLDSARIEQKKFATLLGTTDKTVSAWRTGRSKSYTKYIPQIAEVLGTTTEYLLTGEGPKHKKKSVSNFDALSDEELRLIQAYRVADPHTQSLIDLALEPFME